MPQEDVVLVSGDVAEQLAQAHERARLVRRAVDGLGQPDREIFRRAAAKLGVPVENCLFIGDHRLNDVTGALNAGMQAVWMDDRFPPDHPCLQYPLPQGVPTVTALSQLPELPCLQVPAHSG